MCISPQRRTIFQHLNFQKWSRIVSFLTFSLPNVLFATVACNFSTSYLQKMLRSWRVLYILTSKCAFRHSGVQFLMSPLSTYLRTRRFNRPTFELTRHTNLWKNTAFRDFSNIWRGRIFFLLTFWLLHLRSTDLITLLLLFNSPYCRKFLFKLPSTIFLVKDEWISLLNILQSILSKKGTTRGVLIVLLNAVEYCCIPWSQVFYIKLIAAWALTIRTQISETGT